MGYSKKKIDALRLVVDYICEECHKNEDEVGTLQPHKINPKIGYKHRNIKMVCADCHDYYSSADRIARGIQ